MGAQVEANGVSSERPQILSTALVDLFTEHFRGVSRISYFLDYFMHEATEYFLCCHLTELPCFWVNIQDFRFR